MLGQTWVKSGCEINALCQTLCKGGCFTDLANQLVCTDVQKTNTRASLCLVNAAD